MAKTPEFLFAGAFLIGTAATLRIISGFAHDAPLSRYFYGRCRCLDFLRTKTVGLITDAHCRYRTTLKRRSAEDMQHRLKLQHLLT